MVYQCLCISFYFPEFHYQLSSQDLLTDLYVVLWLPSLTLEGMAISSQEIPQDGFEAYSSF